MARVKGGVSSHARHRKVIKAAKAKPYLLCLGEERVQSRF